MSKRILLVEDNPSDVELISTAFEEVGVQAEYTNFRDGDEAIAGIRQMVQDHHLPHLVLLDLNLPRTSGHQVLVSMRAMAACAGVPVVVLSTSNHTKDRTRCLADGANDYLVKPPHFAELLELAQGLRDRWLSEPVGLPE